VLTSDQNVLKTAGTSAIVRIVPGGTGVSVPLRRWLRLFVKHAVTTASQTCTLHVSVLFKERTT